MPLPIEPVLPQVARALAETGAAVLQAPPGAGKTTRVPLYLLDALWLDGRRIVMLEPRRLAARAAAHRMAQLLGERAGETVGYRMRGDTRVGRDTRIEVVTEGVLTRLIADDPGLEDVGLLIFDEYHERSLQADLGLALALQCRAVLREDLRLLVMSATLDGAAVAALLGGAPVVTSEGRSHPVDTRYAATSSDRSLESRVAAAVREALADHTGDVLVFLPGAAEIRRAASLLGNGSIDPTVTVAMLHGTMRQETQDAALAPSPPGRRKVVLATSIAQTSLTIEGIQVVIDGGLSRVPRFSPRTGMTRLETVRVSSASAEQRRGRAGRLGPGICYRLWTQSEQATLLPRDTPEILDADLTPLALDLAAAGVRDPAEVAWLDPPPSAPFAGARALLAELGALDPRGGLTATGRRMAALPLHPRLAHMVLEAAALDAVALGCDLAEILDERDLLRADGAPPPADLELRLDALRRASGDAGAAHGATVDRDALHRVRTRSAELRRVARAERGTDALSAGALLAFAYPDRIAQRRPGPGGRFLLSNGTGATLPPGDALWDEPYLVVTETDGRRPESRVYLAAAIGLDDIVARHAQRITVERVVEWDPATGAVVARRRERIGAVILRDAPLRDPDPDLVTAALLAGITADGVAALPWTPAARQMRQRVATLARLDPGWPDLSDAALDATLARWLAPHVAGFRRRDDLQRVDLSAVLLEMLGWPRRAALDRDAPTHLVVPSGSRVSIDYADPAAPVLAVRLQELFGLADTPRIAGGRLPLTLHLLSPARRPVQVTRDLAGFWRTTYFDVRKDLRGRYPKHYWPDDPLVAEPTRRAKPRV